MTTSTSRTTWYDRLCRAAPTFRSLEPPLTLPPVARSIAALVGLAVLAVVPVAWQLPVLGVLAGFLFVNGDRSLAFS